MNDQMQQTLAAFLEKFLNGVDTTVQFMSDELPSVIDQLLTWYAVYYGVMFVLGLALLVIAVRLVLAFVKAEPRSLVKDGYSDPTVIGVLLCIFAPFGLFVMSLCLINIQWLQILIAPKIWLIEYASKLAN